MTEEEKQAALEAEEKAKAEAEAQDAVKPEGEQPEGGSDIKKGIDYEAELKVEREARLKAEKAAADNAFKFREEKRKREEEEDYTPPEEKPLTAKEFQAMMAEERQITDKKLNEAKIIDLANRYADSPAEASLIVEIHHNRQFPDHVSVEEQVEEAYLIANRKKILGENSELKRALRAKSGVNNNPANTHQDAPTSGEPQISQGEKTVLSQSGFIWNATARRYEKKLSNGETLVHDLKTKKNFVVAK